MNEIILLVAVVIAINISLFALTHHPKINYKVYSLLAVQLIQILFNKTFLKALNNKIIIREQQLQLEKLLIDVITEELESSRQA